MTYYSWSESPIGELLLTSDGRSLTGLYLKGQKHFPLITTDWQELPDAAPFARTCQQLTEYFNNRRQQFNLPLSPKGTNFQKQVWQHLSDIPFGRTISYGELARRLGQPNASRAVGATNGRNPISIIVPCHRVIAANGRLTGYAGGIERKHWLLQHEEPVAQLDLLYQDT
ncbi:methylated-DNA--[protein]-cysteine S-methyltransferase [cf. Phormidesmis sp. LEGE 11477]|uniref:methylated-DNA--[protein]-cysteine S-methyltransferase n=1 Tax=cf. Phormidesmis sp. LEGE 11477 TaxID=1828680 RepID=UPI0018829C9C|nr:methylated-DNA--[protein]-cysteine S-methyltransferase [cf. Phormidesmis sp. LEGE 11477]MBE9062183.1 methylated-DNA--[protein]-cysteine S-methyltransferase [cf. Phormidesmis sp. LEGE 11477]